MKLDISHGVRLLGSMLGILIDSLSYFLNLMFHWWDGRNFYDTSRCFICEYKFASVLCYESKSMD